MHTNVILTFEIVCFDFKENKAEKNRVKNFRLL